jgi:hypothetical protein
MFRSGPEVLAGAAVALGFGLFFGWKVRVGLKIDEREIEDLKKKLELQQAGQANPGKEPRAPASPSRRSMSGRTGRRSTS